jgi:protein-S-isoprenylcysteine O-methyltransferase Ste14
MPDSQKLHIKDHRLNSHLSGEYKYGDVGQIILFIVFIATMITDSFIFHYSTQYSDIVPLQLRIFFAASLLTASVILAIRSIKLVFGEENDQSDVIRHNVFNRVRHPMYLSAILLYVALFFLSFSISCALIILVIILFYHKIARYEERILLQRFGKEYKRYMDKVPMWIPRLKRSEKSDSSRSV